MALTSDQITAQNFADFYQKILPYLNGGGMGMKLLWENSDPTQSMDNGTEINLSSDDYDLLCVITLNATNNTRIVDSNIVPKGSSFLVCRSATGSGGAVTRERNVNRVSDIKYTVGDATTATGTTAQTTANNTMILYRIYGLKVYNRDVHGKTTLLWSNPNPTSEFSAGDITLANSDYDMLLWVYVCLFSSNTTYTGSVTVKKGYDAYCNTITPRGGDAGIMNLAYRKIAYVSDTKYTAEGGYVATIVAQPTAQNKSCVPLAVYGIKL